MKVPSRLRVSGYWLIIVSVLHVIVGIVVFQQPLFEMYQQGGFNTVAPDPWHPIYEREDAFWFMMAAPSIFAAGLLCLWAAANHLSLPSSLGWTLLVTAGVGCFIEPISGSWLLLPPSVLILFAGHQ